MLKTKLERIWLKEHSSQFPEYTKEEHLAMAKIFAEEVTLHFPTEEELKSFIKPNPKTQLSKIVHQNRTTEILYLVLDVFETNRMSYRDLINVTSDMIDRYSSWEKGIDFEKYHLNWGDRSYANREAVLNLYMAVFENYLNSENPSINFDARGHFLLFVELHFQLLKYLQSENYKAGTLRIQLAKHGIDFLRDPFPLFIYYLTNPTKLDRHTLNLIEYDELEALKISKFIEAYTEFYEKNELLNQPRREITLLTGKKVKDVEELQQENQKLSENNVMINRELGTRNRKIIELRKRLQKGHLTKSDMQNFIDQTRKKNGKKNYTKLGITLGIHKDTAKRRVKELGLSDY